MPDAPMRPERIGILLNPRSGRVRRQLAAVRRVAASLPDAWQQEVGDHGAIAQALGQWRPGPADLLVVLGGDGTLQATLTALLREPAGGLPRLLAVPGGTTNMSALDLGARAKPEAALRALSAWLRGAGPAPKAVQRAVLRVDAGSNPGPEFGMFFGTGAILDGVRYYHGHIRANGVRGALGPTLAFARMLLSLPRRHAHPLLPPMQARLSTADGDWENDWLLVLASTLHRLLAGCRPYWGTEPAPMHVTAVTHQPRHLGRVLPAVLCGHGAAVAREDDGYLSRNLDGLSLNGPREFLIDGELFQAREAIRLSSTPPLHFLSY